MPGMLFPFPVIAELELHDISVTLDLLHKQFQFGTSLCLHFFFHQLLFQEMIQTGQRVGDITDGMCLNVKNKCVYDRSR